jgi:hypothetical protein
MGGLPLLIIIFAMSTSEPRALNDARNKKKLVKQ